MPKRATDVYWREHRVGSTVFYYYGIMLDKLTFDNDLSITELVEVPRISFDPDFVELFGLPAGVNKE
jgi:hypothetical protein